MSQSVEEQVLYKNVDWSSFSNPTEVVSTNIRLEWHLDFESHVLFGAVEHIIKVLSSQAKEIYFDSSNINIVGDVLINNEIATYSVADKHPVLGSKITVEIPESLQYDGASFPVLFQYSISPEASAVQWLAASATKGGKYPYVFTQSQAIHARSLLPCMDTPGVKTPYTAVVTAPKWCTVLMSALADSNDNISGRLSNFPIPEDCNRFHWTQPVPTPAYLIALAGGDLVSKDISDRVRIWSEPDVINAAHFEFSETEEFVQAAEEITGCPYQWRRYDVLCLPPSFPYGGMENPCLTFATPTLLAGDKSLADVIAHEIAHSWTGNLVTNLTWDHFWLNEGWTVWLERKITSKVKNNDEVGKLSAKIGYKHLMDDVKRMGSDNPFTCAVWPLNGQDPDDAFSSVPYEKGFNLLMYLETMVGRDVFEAFAQAYIDKFKFSTVTSGSFRDCFVNFITKVYNECNAPGTASKDSKKKKGKSKVKSTAPVAGAPALSVSASIWKQVQGIDWIELFCSPGMPKHVPDYSNSLSDTAVKLAKNWIDNMDNLSSITASSADMKGWSSQQIQIFLEEFINYPLPEGSSYSLDLLNKLDAQYTFTSSQNSEIMFRWQTLCLRSNMEAILPYVVKFITSQGRMKFVRPLYRALGMSKIGRKLALDTFQEFKDTYHPIARKMLEADLNKIAILRKEEEGEEEGDDDEEYETTGGRSRKSTATASNDFEDVQTGVNEIILAVHNEANNAEVAPPMSEEVHEKLNVEEEEFEISHPANEIVGTSPDPLWQSPVPSSEPPTTPFKATTQSIPATPIASFQTPTGAIPPSVSSTLATASSAPPTPLPGKIELGKSPATLPPAQATKPTTASSSSSNHVAEQTKAANSSVPTPTEAKKPYKPEPKNIPQDVIKPTFTSSPTFFALLALGFSFGAFYFLRLRHNK